MVDLTRREILAGSAGGMAIIGAALPNDQANASIDLGVDDPPAFAHVDGERWMRVHNSSAGELELHFGSGGARSAVLRSPVGIAWYRPNSRLPDGDRRVAWTRMSKRPMAGVLVRLFATIPDPAGGRWQVVSDVRQESGGYVVSSEFQRQGIARLASVRVHGLIDAPPARASNFVPGVLYNGNRADAIVPRGYCPLLSEGEAVTRETIARRVVADIPRQDASTWWTVHLWGNQPASAEICAFDPDRRAGVILGCARRENGRVVGLIYTADQQTGLHQLTIENPSVRERRYRGCRWEPSADVPHLYQDGERATISMRIVPVRAPDMPAFISSWTGERELRRQGRGLGQDGRAVGVPDVVPRSYAAQLALAFQDKRLWNEKEQFYQTIRNENEREPRQLILGWGSGVMTLFATYRLGDDRAKERVRKSIAMIVDQGQAPTGLFYGARMKDGRWLAADGSLDSFRAMNSLTPRRTTDTVFAGFDLIDLMAPDEGDTPSTLIQRFDASLHRACDALVRVWQQEGEIPFLLNPHTAKPVWRGGFGGARAVGCLVRGAARWRRPRMLQVAGEIADRYIAEGIARGETWGGPSDVMQGTADQESLTALAEGLVLLHRATGEPRYLAAAGHAADILATWALSDHIEFPPESVLGSRGIHPFGALVANTQNMWATPGLCTNSGRFLIDLYAATGEARYLDLLSDIARASMQMMVTPDRDWGPRLEPGQMTECLSFGDVPEEFGDAYLGSATWPVNALLLSEAELPSIYVDGKRVWRFDHLGASWQRGVLRIANETRFPATARVLWRDGRTASVTLAPGASAPAIPA